MRIPSVKSGFIIAFLAILAALFLFWDPPDINGNFPYSKINWPEDDKSHLNNPQVVTEWWYFTGKVTATRGLEVKHFSYYVTLRYMRDIAGDIPTLDVQLTNIETEETYGTSIELETAKLSRYTTSIHGKDFLLAPENGHYLLNLSFTGQNLLIQMDLTLQAVKQPLLVANNPKQPGLVDMGSQKNSFYYVMTRLSTSGTIQIGNDKYTIKVDPRFSSSIMEHQWGDFSVPHVLEKHPWIWMALILEDGTDINVGQFISPQTGIPMGRGYASIHDPQGKTRYAVAKITLGKDFADGYPLEYTVEIEDKTYRLKAVVAHQDANDVWMGIMSVNGSNVLEPGATYAFAENTVFLKETKDKQE